MIVLYKGRRGAGKTLTLVKDAKKYQEQGWKIYRNIEVMSFGEFIKDEEILKLDKNHPIQDAVICIDEAQIFFDSRRSMKNQNIKFSNFVQQIRKRNIIMLVTTQYTNTIDLRIRQHVDVIATPRFNKKYPVCEVTYTDMTSIDDETLIEPQRTRIVYNPIPIFELFDTREMIK